MALTKEEKKARKEAKKLEKLKAEAEVRKKLKREELQREMTAQALKRDELDRSWREMMLKIKEPVFRKDIEVMWHCFERAYDKKDCLISQTMKLMNVADDQFQRTVASFCDTIDTMINKFLAELEGMSKENTSRTSKLLKRGEDEASNIMKDHNAAETHLQLMLYHGHTTADTLAWTIRGENMVKEDEEINKYVSVREDLRSFLENNYNNLWEEYKSVLKAYVVNTADNQKQARKLRRKENKMADVIASQGKKIANSDGLLKRLRLELQAYESGTKQAVFRDRRDRYREACHKLKHKLVQGCDTDERQLSILVQESDAAVEWLDAAHKKGEKILRLAALCRRYETQREKVMPYGTTEPHSSTQTTVKARCQQSEDSLVVNAVASTYGLTRLWHRISKVELARRALLREKMLLERENDVIMRQIDEYRETRLSTKSAATSCICNYVPKSKDIKKPVAIEGVLTLAKYKMK